MAIRSGRSTGSGSAAGGAEEGTRLCSRRKSWVDMDSDVGRGRLLQGVKGGGRPIGRGMPQEIDVSPISPERFRSVLSPDRFAAFERAADDARELLDGRVV